MRIVTREDSHAQQDRGRSDATSDVCLDYPCILSSADICKPFCLLLTILPASLPRD